MWSDLSRQGRSAVQTIIGTCTVLLVLSLGMAWIRSSDRTASRHNREHKAAMLAANTACGTAPVSVTMHNASGDYGPWIEIKCRNGTVKVSVP